MANPFRNFFDNMVRAQERHARREIANVLAGMDDETLRRIGVSRGALRERRSRSTL